MNDWIKKCINKYEFNGSDGPLKWSLLSSEIPTSEFWYYFNPFDDHCVEGKTFGMIDITACLCMSGGLVFFTLADSTVSPTFSLYGT